MTQLDDRYTEFYARTDPDRTYPNEYIIRVFLGTYPHLKLQRDFAGKKILDMGMGDGRNLRFFAEKGFEAYGVEVTEGICSRVRESFKRRNLKANVRVGKNGMIPFEDGYFDYVVSWNSSHYMGNLESYALYREYVREFRRVLTRGGMLMLAVPVETNFIFEAAAALEKGYQVITEDPYGIRNGQVFRAFRDRLDILSELEGAFEDFSCASLVDDCFGQKNHYEVVVCRKCDQETGGAP